MYIWPSFLRFIASYSFARRCGKKALAALGELLCHVHRHMLPSVRHLYVSNVTSHCLQQQVKMWWNCPERAFRLAYWLRCRNGVPASTEVVERRSGSFRLKLSTVDTSFAVPTKKFLLLKKSRPFYALFYHSSSQIVPAFIVTSLTL